MLRNKIAYRLRELRKAKKLSQQKLAERAGISYQYLGNLERSEASATLDSLEKLVRALGCTPGELLAADEVLGMKEVHELLADVPEKARVHLLSAMRHVILAVNEASRERGGGKRRS